jgi:glycosyltransferase involved in cell wall biosynthesis
MIENKNIVFFGPSDWWSMNPSSGTHIARKLSKTNILLYVNPISTDLSGTLKNTGVSGKFFSKVWRKLKSFSKSMKQVDANLYVFSPVFIPIQGSGFWDALNNALIRFQLKRKMSSLKIKKSLLWVENMRSVDFARTMKWDVVLYHASDIFVEDRYTRNKSKLVEREAYISQHSDIIICVSRELYEEKKQQHPHVHYLPHGVDYDLFRDAAEKNQLYPKLESVKKPLIGYFGTLTNANDIAMMEYCVETLPEYTFVFAGQVTAGDYSTLKSKSNVLFLGKVPYEDIPLLCASFDVCIMFWKMSTWIEHCNPLKLFEYMSSGKPIVSIPINEIVKNYADVVSIARTPEAFVEALEWELKKDTKKRREKRLQIACSHSWNTHIEAISTYIEDALRGKITRNKEA